MDTSTTRKLLPSSSVLSQWNVWKIAVLVVGNIMKDTSSAAEKRSWLFSG